MNDYVKNNIIYLCMFIQAHYSFVTAENTSVRQDSFATMSFSFLAIVGWICACVLIIQV